MLSHLTSNLATGVRVSERFWDVARATKAATDRDSKRSTRLALAPIFEALYGAPGRIPHTGRPAWDVTLSNMGVRRCQCEHRTHTCMLTNRISLAALPPR